MFEDEENVSQGYGSTQDMMPQDPAMGGAPAGQGGGEGGDPVVAGLTAFMETQDPQIAVEVCTMLAEQMGIGAQPAPAPAPAGGGVPPMGAPAPAAPAPMGMNGMTVKPKLF